MADLIAAGTAQRLVWYLVVIPGWLPSALGSACGCQGLLGSGGSYAGGGFTGLAVGYWSDHSRLLFSG